MAALERRGPGLAGASGRGGPGLWALQPPRTPGHPHPSPGAGRGWAGPGGGGGMEEPLVPVRGGPRRKHKMEEEEEEPDGCPATKKRLAGRGHSPATPPAPQWRLGPPDPSLHSLPGTPSGLGGPCEEMEQAAMGEQQQQQQQQQQQCEAARRKLQEIEDRITEEEEEEDEDGLVAGPPGSLPTLVLSDTLKTGLKRDYTGDLTKKIIESMSRPSMELVVWKPLPEFLTKKAKPVSVKNYKPMTEGCSAKSATLEAAFSLQTGKFCELQQTEMPSPFYSAVEPAGCSEEEMEL